MPAARFLFGWTSSAELAESFSHLPCGTDQGLAPTAVAWRLVAGNNHGLGRGPRSYVDLAACHAAIERLRSELADAELITTQAPGTSAAWGWRVQLAGENVAVSSRTYQRQRESRYSLEQFLAAVPLAEPSVTAIARPRHRVVRRADRLLSGPPRTVLSSAGRVLT